MKNKEIELKLLISRADLRKLLNANFMQEEIVKGSKAKHNLVSSYYDTEDLYFKKNGIAYRVRDKGDGSFEATVKTGKKNQGGITERIEINIPLDKDEAVLEGFGALGLGYELTELAPDGVTRLFTVDVERTTYDLKFHGSTFELAVDKGKITSELTKNKAKIDEMEIEIKEGSVKDLLQLAALISQTVPVFVEPRSKFARGLALIGEDATYPVVKRKMGDASVRNELLETFTQKGNAALLAQSVVMQDDLSDSALKNLAKQSEYMLSLMLFASELDSKGLFEEYIDMAKEILHVIYRVLDLREMHALWRSVDVQGKAFSKTIMSITLNDNIAKAEAVLVEHLKLGKLTAVFYGVQSALASSEWDNEEYMEAASIARNVLKKWQEAFESEKNPEAALSLADKIIYLARSVEAKFADKLAGNLKKKRNSLISKALDKRMEQEIIRMLQLTNSKYIYRDAGVLLGMLIAKKK
ncbi:MAG: CYTH domain-containing protein [Phascolarctobacterium sp.]|nr:CYTH domain-containing protein [Phascolarctobacterium sp.]